MTKTQEKISTKPPKEQAIDILEWLSKGFNDPKLSFKLNKFSKDNGYSWEMSEWTSKFNQALNLLRSPTEEEGK